MVRRTPRNTLLTMLGLALGSTCFAMTGGAVDPKFQGAWVPASAGCSSALRVVIEADKVTFQNGAERAEYGRLEQCFTCAAGGATNARQPTWLTTDKMGDSPWQLTLDDTRKGRVAVTAEFPNDRRMAARFPLGNAPLNRCEGAAAAVAPAGRTAAAPPAAGARPPADRTIALAPVVRSSWEFPTHTNVPRQRPSLGVGFWQRASGAAAGVGSHYISAFEFQLPETAPARVRSATFQFSGRPSQCTGAEPVVVDVFAFAGDGRGDVGDTRAGSRIAQLSADCSDRNAFSRPIDVTAMVRQMAIPAGVRYVGFNIRKGNSRQGPGLFELAPGKLTVVLADRAVEPQAAAANPQPAEPSTPTHKPAGGEPTPPKDFKELKDKVRRALSQRER